MKRYVDFSKIPMKGKLKDWKNSIGCKCNFVYDDINGIIEIVDYKNSYITLRYNNNVNTIRLGSFVNGKIGSVLNKRTKNFKVEIGTKFVSDNRNITILDREYRIDSNGREWKWYKYKCNICTWNNGWNEESHILHNIGCSCCSGTTVVKGINDIATTHPDYIIYFKNIEDAYYTSYCNAHEYMMKCPICGDEKLWTTERLTTRGFACKKCGDGVSFGEKYVYSLLAQLNINFVTEYNKTNNIWCKDYRYDFYLPDFKCIIEVHGLQHYQESRKNCGKFRGYEEEHANDIAKEKLAKDNNIKHYIIIDVRESNSKYIKNSILKSELFMVLNVNALNIDWDACAKYTATSRVVEVCKYKNNHMDLSTAKIGNKFHMHSTTVLRYLKRGVEIGICNYNLEEENKRKYKEYRDDSFRFKPIYCLNIGLYFMNHIICSDYIQSIYDVTMYSPSIKTSITKDKPYKGFTFQYVSKQEFNRVKSESPELAFGDFFILPERNDISA